MSTELAAIIAELKAGEVPARTIAVATERAGRAPAESEPSEHLELRLELALAFNAQGKRWDALRVLAPAAPDAAADVLKLRHGVNVASFYTSVGDPAAALLRLAEVAPLLQLYREQHGFAFWTVCSLAWAHSGLSGYARLAIDAASRCPLTTPSARSTLYMSAVKAALASRDMDALDDLRRHAIACENIGSNEIAARIAGEAALAHAGFAIGVGAKSEAVLTIDRALAKGWVRGSATTRAAFEALKAYVDGDNEMAVAKARAVVANDPSISEAAAAARRLLALLQGQRGKKPQQSDFSVQMQERIEQVCAHLELQQELQGVPKRDVMYEMASMISLRRRVAGDAPFALGQVASALAAHFEVAPATAVQLGKSVLLSDFFVPTQWLRRADRKDQILILRQQVVPLLKAVASLDRGQEAALKAATELDTPENRLWTCLSCVTYDWMSDGEEPVYADLMVRVLARYEDLNRADLAPLADLQPPQLVAAQGVLLALVVASDRY